MSLLEEIEKRLMEESDLSELSAREQYDLLASRAKHIVRSDELLETLERCVKEKRPMRIKYGIDATGQSIHLGHAVPLFVLRRLQRMGHHVTLLIGDFTARVGDPSGRVSTRPVLSREEIRKNAERYAEQAGHIIDLSKTEVVFNSDWLEPYPLATFFSVLSGLTVSSAMQRDDFRKRESITRAELLYSTLMGIDSLHLESELELGGDDQLLNFYDAVRIMENAGVRPESAVTTDILLGTSGDGQKMSKSIGNYILVSETPNNMFGKLMSIADHQLEQYFKLITDISDDDWQVLEGMMANGSMNPMEVKRMLGRIIVTQLHGTEAAKVAEEDFDNRIVKKVVPDDIPTCELSQDSLRSWAHLVSACGFSQAKSVASAQRLIDGGGVHFIETDGSVTTVSSATPLPSIGKSFALRLGKRTFIRVSLV
jgi:tyrosyl-tRNA synthetase